MGTEEEDEDFVFYGTPIEREEEISARKRKTISDSGSLRSLPSWKQEVRDEEGRRRLHGAFTGGFSAGYYNTVGSKEGWTPQTFSSSRKNRAEVKKQSIYSFLDEEDIKDMGGQGLETSLKFDTFGFTAAEHARKLAEKEQKSRPSAIPGPVPDEILVPVTSSIGIKLLLKMGWRRGHSIKETQANSLNDARREARKALLAFSGNDMEEVAKTDIALSNAGEPTQMGDDTLFSSKATPAYVINPKQDLYGLGFDPFKHAPEFRDRKASMARNDHPGSKRVNSMIGNLFVSNSGKYAPGFGIGALEELDVEDEDIYATGLELAGNEVQEDEISRIAVDGKLSLGNSKKGILHGFKVALKSDYSLERFDPPNIPPDFTPHHKFASPLETVDKLLEPPPPEVPPPDDDNLRLLIDGFANLVSRCGKLFEDLSKEKHRSNPLFSFLNGGSGYNYYTWKLWEAKRRRADQEEHTAMESIPSDQRMTAESRGKLLGEKPLEKSSNISLKSASLNEVVQFPTNLSDTFTKATKFLGPSELVKPFGDDPLKQKRFELFLKEKHEGGLRSSSFSGANKMSESERARERLDFEAAAEAIAKFAQSAKDSLQTKQKSIEFSIIGDEHFVSSSGGQISQDEDKLVGKVLPTREEFQWRPSPLLCKRFDILDPYMGKPPPAPRPRSKMDALVFMVDSNLDSKKEAIPTSSRDQSSSAAHKDSFTTVHLEAENASKLAAEQAEAALSLHMQKPVDLYKAIFSDDSEDEDDSSIKEAAKLDKTSEVTNTTLNSLIAGDFLESLGKELGLEVPAEAKEVRVYDSKPPEIEPPSVCPRNVHQSYAKESASAESDRPENTKRENTMVFTIDGHGDHDNVFLGHKTKEIDRKKEPRKHRASSRRRRGGSESDSSSSGSGYHDRSRSEKKVSSTRKHARHKHKSSRSRSRYPSEESESGLSDDSRRGRSSKDTRKQHSGRSKADGKKNR